MSSKSSSIVREKCLVGTRHHASSTRPVRKVRVWVDARVSPESRACIDASINLCLCAELENETSYHWWTDRLAALDGVNAAEISNCQGFAAITYPEWP